MNGKTFVLLMILFFILMDRNKKPDSKKQNAQYLGLQMKEPSTKIQEIISQALTAIAMAYPNLKSASDLLTAIQPDNLDPKELGGTWKYPKHWHVTTLFRKGKTLIKSHPAYKSFEEGREITILIKGLAFVPEKIVTFIVFTEVPLENKFPHMTALLGSYSAKHSNDVLEQLFGEGQQLEEVYTKLKTNDEGKEEVYKVDCQLLSKDESVYVAIFKDPISLQTEMKEFY